MKKLILSLSLLFVGSQAMSQVIVNQTFPSNIAYQFGSAGAGWGYDMSLPGNFVQDTIALAVDSLACTALTNSLTGKIAILYRGSCQFGVKAENAQLAGAVGVIIINNAPGAPIDPGSGTNGGNVTIPVVMISDVDGASLRTAMQSGSVIMYIGNKTGFYPNDISIYDNRSLRAEVGSIPALLAANATDFNAPVGTWAYNYGQNSQTGVRMSASVLRNGTSVFTQTTPAVNIAVGDSAYFTMPNFSLATYPTGNYEFTYNVEAITVDDYALDNQVIYNFSVSDSMWSLARLDSVSNVVADNFYRPNTLPITSFRPCIALKNPNANLLSMEGVYYGGIFVSVADTATVNVNGQLLSATLFTWDDVDNGSATATFDLLNEVATGDFSYTTESPDSMIYIPFSMAYNLVANQKYLVCVTTFEPKLFTAYADKDFYDENIFQNDYVRFPVFSDDVPVNGGQGFGIPASIAAKVSPALGVNESTIETSTFPNPTKDIITVKVNASGSALLNVTDLAGRTVSTENVKIVGGQFTTNVAAMSAGTYVFSLEFANGTSSRFNVVVAK